MDEKNDRIKWNCDNCFANLNKQKGFKGETGKQTCSECGSENYVQSLELIKEYQSLYNNECPKCNGHIELSSYSDNVWICEDCGVKAIEKDCNILWVESDEEDNIIQFLKGDKYLLLFFSFNF